MNIDPKKEVEGFLDLMKAHFRAVAPKKSAKQLQAQKEELARSLPQGTEIDDKLLSIATSMHMVETISLLSNSRNSGFVGVNMYVDDEGSVRDAPRNFRASEIAHCCGRPLDVRGDAFLARVLDDGDAFERQDMRLSEVSSSAQWVKEAQKQSIEKREQDSAENIMRKMQQQPVATGRLRELTPAEAAKEEGNASFQQQKWDTAIEHYTKALQLDENMLPALNNRAMAYIKINKWEDALRDCVAVLEKQPTNVKALLRSGLVEEKLNQIESAKRRYEEVLRAEPHNKEAQVKLAVLSAMS